MVRDGGGRKLSGLRLQTMFSLSSYSKPLFFIVFWPVRFPFILSGIKQCFSVTQTV